MHEVLISGRKFVFYLLLYHQVSLLLYQNYITSSLLNRAIYHTVIAILPNSKHPVKQGMFPFSKRDAKLGIREICRVFVKNDSLQYDLFVWTAMMDSSSSTFYMWKWYTMCTFRYIHHKLLLLRKVTGNPATFSHRHLVWNSNGWFRSGAHSRLSYYEW